MMPNLPQINCFSQKTQGAHKLIILNELIFKRWLTKQHAYVKKCVAACAFKAIPQSMCYLLDTHGNLESILIGVANCPNIYAVSHLPLTLEEGSYILDDPEHILDDIDYGLGWALGAYQFTRYKKATRMPCQLVLTHDEHALLRTKALVKATYLVRSLTMSD